MDPYFWTHLVMQFSTFEPAVRYSVVAISSLYEQMHSGPRPARLLAPADNRLALTHYNSAIRELRSMDNEPLVLLVCILFVCIEILLGNRETAIQHCKHGVFILENVKNSYSWAKEHLSPVFRRMTLIPFFFSKDYTSFPQLLGLEDHITDSFRSLDEAQYYVDGIVARTVRLVRNGDVFRLGDKRHSPVPPELMLEQAKIRAVLNEWNSRFTEFQGRSSRSGNPDAARCSIILRYEIASIWVETAFEYDEMVYDKYLDRFRWMVSQAAELHSAKTSVHGMLQETPKFIFEPGFIPLLYYVVIKCRCLATRTQALSLMKNLGVSRENLWEVSTMHAVGRRFIEIEHGVVLDGTGQPSDSARWPGFPPDEVRIRDSTTEPKPTVRIDACGQEIRGRMAGFFRRTPEGNIYLQTEFVSEIP
ncbi:hypothetical protein AAE478_008104 [Parahypoxylon ruwenzoriense]